MVVSLHYSPKTLVWKLANQLSVQLAAHTLVLILGQDISPGDFITQMGPRQRLHEADNLSVFFGH
jgi:hypothetical protein